MFKTDNANNANNANNAINALLFNGAVVVVERCKLDIAAREEDRAERQSARAAGWRNQQRVGGGIPPGVRAVTSQRDAPIS